MSAFWSARHVIPWYILARPVEYMLVLFNARSNDFYVFDQIGADIWEALRDTSALIDTRQRLLDQYEIEPQVLDAELQPFLHRLLQLGLLTVETNTP